MGVADAYSSTRNSDKINAGCNNCFGWLSGFRTVREVYAQCSTIISAGLFYLASNKEILNSCS